MHGLLRCNINTGVHARGQSGRVTQRCHNSPDGKRGYRVRVTSHTGTARRIWGILKKISWVEFCLGRRRLAFTSSWRPCGGCRTRRGADGKARIERMRISLPYVEEPLNSKVIKCFVPELRSRKCFSCFEIPMFYVYMLWTFYVRFTHSRIGLWYKISAWNCLLSKIRTLTVLVVLRICSLFPVQRGKTSSKLKSGVS